ncbi:hypothetical protein ABFJ78_33470 [Amycolatopsis sp. MEPSY49]
MRTAVPVAGSSVIIGVRLKLLSGVLLATVQSVGAGVFARLEAVERTDVNENSTPRLVANPNRIQVRTEADLRRGAPPAEPEVEAVRERH